MHSLLTERALKVGDTIHLLREWPPGYGGVERVCHELASVSNGVVVSFDVRSKSSRERDPLDVGYERLQLPRGLTFGRLYLPRPSWLVWKLIFSAQPLHGHLPSPGVLVLLLLARLLRPRRQISVHWHCFLAANRVGLPSLQLVYQAAALFVLHFMSGVITTSPPLAVALEKCGCPAKRIAVLPCSLSEEFEHAALDIPLPAPLVGAPLRVLFIGRLDSYKRVDWLIESLSSLSSPWHLSVVGDGPKRSGLECLFQSLKGPHGSAVFHGRLSEADKLQQLAAADVLVLPSDRCNEGFGIVQLEAMAAGIPALAFDLPRSGMGWVGQLTSLNWPQTPESLPAVLQQLASDPSLRAQLGREARERYLRLFSRAVWLQRLQALDHDGRNEPCGGSLAPL